MILVATHVCVCMYVCMYVCTCSYIITYVCTYLHISKILYSLPFLRSLLFAITVANHNYYSNYAIYVAIQLHIYGMLQKRLHRVYVYVVV